MEDGNAVAAAAHGCRVADIRAEASAPSWTDREASCRRVTAARNARRARAWAAENPGNVAIRNEAAGVLTSLTADALRGDGPVLDLGCGTGWWLERLAAGGVAPERLYGIDASAERVAAARARAPGATVVCGDARALRWEDDTFAVVYLLLVLSSLEDGPAVRAVLAEARRVLRPGGAIAIWEPRVPTPWNPRRRWIRGRELEAVLGSEVESRPVTLLPAVARRLGRATGVLYPLLARVAALRTHRVSAWRTTGTVR